MSEPIYLDENTLKSAVSRLGVCSASSSLADYLIFKRAHILTLRDTQPTADGAESVPVVTGTKSTPFSTAISELTGLSGSLAHSATPYFVPFGASRDTTRGYRTAKFPSNGSSDTANRWQSRRHPPVVLVPDTSPKAFRITPRTSEQLSEFFLTKSASGNFSGEPPRLLDASIWWFRSSDLSSRFGHSPSEADLIDAFVSDFALTAGELAALFLPEPQGTQGSRDTAEADQQ